MPDPTATPENISEPYLTKAEAAKGEGLDIEAHRLHPLSLLIRLIAFVPQFLFATIAATLSMDSATGRLVIGLGLLAGIIIFAFVNWLRWSKFTYEIDAQEVRIKSGVISRNNRAIPYERIQDVNIEQKLIARIFGLAVVKLETGSAGNGNDGELNAVKVQRAEELRDVIKARKAGIAITPLNDAVDNAAEASIEQPPLFTMPPKRLLILGLFSFSLAIFAFLAAIFQNFDFLIPDSLFSADRFVDQFENGTDGRDSQIRNGISNAENTIGKLGPFGQLLTAGGGLIVLIAIGFATGIITVFLRDFGFRLDRTENGFRRRRGLLTLTDVAMPLHRVQAALLITGPVRKRFGWFALKFQSLASDGKNESDHVVAPLARLDEAIGIAREPDINIDMPADNMAGVSPAMWVIPAIFACCIATIGVGNGVFWSGLPWLALLLLVLIPFVAHLWLRWRFHRHAADGKYLYVRSGYWSQRLTILPLRKIQSVDVTQNFVQRPLSQADIILGVAGGSGIIPLTMHALDEAEAYQLRDLVLAAHGRAA